MSATQAPEEVHVPPGESIQRALDACGPGAVVRLGEGTYHGSVVVAQSGIVLRGAGAGRTVLVPGDVAPTDVPPLHDAPPDVISGLTVYGGGDGPVGDVTISGLTVRGFSGTGVYAHSVAGITVEDVEADGNAVWGLYFRESSGVTAARCRASGSRYAGIGLAFCPTSDALIADCETTGNAFGVFVDNSSRARVLRNHCHGNAAGILLLHQTYEGELPGGVRDCLVADNDVVGNNVAAGGDEPEEDRPATPPMSGIGIAMIGTERVAMVGNRISGHAPEGPSVMAAAFTLSSSADWGGSDPVDNTIEWNTIAGNQPRDVQIDTDPSQQRFANNVVGTSMPEAIDGCLPEGSR